MSSPESPFVRSKDQASEILEESLRAVARRSVPALRRIYDLMASQLLAELLQRLGDRQIAERALADSFELIWNQAVHFSPERSRPEAWLRAIVHQQAVGVLREGSVTAPAEEVDGVVLLLNASIEAQGLPPEQKLLQLAWNSGRSPRELASALQIPVRQVRQEIHVAIAALVEQHPVEHHLGASRRPKWRGSTLEHVAAAYTLGAFVPGAHRRFEAMMTKDAEVRRAWQRWGSRLAGLSLEIPTVRPPDNTWSVIEQRLMPAARARPKSPLRWSIMAVLLALAALAFVWMRLRRH